MGEIGEIKKYNKMNDFLPYSHGLMLPYPSPPFARINS
jgi:hypothetical protein